MKVPRGVGAPKRQRRAIGGDAVPQLLAREVVQLVVPHGEVPVPTLGVGEDAHDVRELPVALLLGLERVGVKVERALVIDDVAVVQHEREVVVLVEVLHRVLGDDQGVAVPPPLRPGEVGFIVAVHVLDVREEAEAKRGGGGRSGGRLLASRWGRHRRAHGDATPGDRAAESAQSPLHEQPCARAADVKGERATHRRRARDQ